MRLYLTLLLLISQGSVQKSQVGIAELVSRCPNLLQPIQTLSLNDHHGQTGSIDDSFYDNEDFDGDWNRFDNVESFDPGNFDSWLIEDYDNDYKQLLNMDQDFLMEKGYFYRQALHFLWSFLF